MIGSLGEVAFEASSKRVRTPDGLQRNATARLAVHELINRKPLSEFVGAALETISFRLVLSIWQNVDPLEEVKQLRKMRDTGLAVAFILDGEPQGEGLWTVETLNEEWDYIDNEGRPGIIRCSVTIKEYIEYVR